MDATILRQLGAWRRRDAKRDAPWTPTPCGPQTRRSAGGALFGPGQPVLPEPTARWILAFLTFDELGSALLCSTALAALVARFLGLAHSLTIPACFSATRLPSHRAALNAAGCHARALRTLAVAARVGWSPATGERVSAPALERTSDAVIGHLVRANQQRLEGLEILGAPSTYWSSARTVLGAVHGTTALRTLRPQPFSSALLLPLPHLEELDVDEDDPLTGTLLTADRRRLRSLSVSSTTRHMLDLVARHSGLHTLELSFGQLSIECAEALNACVAQLPALTELELRVDECAALGKLVWSLPTVTRLSLLWHRGLTPAVCAVRLQRLVVSQWDDWPQLLAGVASSSTTDANPWPELTELCLRCSMPTLPSLVVAWWPRLTTLELCLQEGSAAAQMLFLLSRLPLLRSAEFSAMVFGHSLGAPLPTGGPETLIVCEHLQTLTLNFAGDALFACLKLPVLSKLALCGRVSVDVRRLDVLLTRLPSLRRLEVLAMHRSGFWSYLGSGHQPRHNAARSTLTELQIDDCQCEAAELLGLVACAPRLVRLVVVRSHNVDGVRSHNVDGALLRGLAQLRPLHLAVLQLEDCTNLRVDAALLDALIAGCPALRQIVIPDQLAPAVCASGNRCLARAGRIRDDAQDGVFSVSPPS